MSAGPRDRPRPVAGLGWRHRLRGTTALQAVATAALLAAPVPAVAGGLSPNAQPTGGQVVAGQAGIAQSVTSTVVTQSSQRAAVNWQSFDVGSSQTVQFVQPNASSATLNRVVGPNPSEIAGKINANGQIVVVNQAGVVFDRGAQINATGIVVSAAGISNANFMAGKMVFDEAADPNAKIVNRGTLTVGQHGLAALVAPQVRNAGVIRAPLGTVIMAGAETDTLDLYGDGLVSINVTKQVTQAPDGGRALVTNAGVVSARGGAVVLTADAVDGVVQTLVDAGGRISANSAAGRTGRVLISGAGGDVRVEGAVSAQGNEPGTTGGEVRVSGSRGTVVGAHAQINASGQAGGGVVALGTTLARAKSGSGIAAATTKALAVKPGAVISANATARGNGGRVVGLSAGTTTVAGTIDAMGGPAGGNGGFVETSGATVNLGAALVDTLAPMGTAGSWLLDPSDFTVQTMAQADQIATDLGLGNVEIQTTSGAAVYPPGTGTETSPGTGNITINYVISAPANVNTLELNAYDGIQINSVVNVGTGGTLQLVATNNITQGTDGVIAAGTLTANSADGAAHIGIATNFITTLGASSAPMAFGLRVAVPTLTVSGAVNGGIGVYIVNSGGDIAVNAGLVSTNVVALTASGGITEGSSVVISTPTLNGSAGGSVALIGPNNVGTIGAFAATDGFTMTDNSALTIVGPVQSSAGSINLIDTNSGGITFADGGTLEVVNGGTIGLRTDTLANLGTTSATGIANADNGTFELAPYVSGINMNLGAAGAPGALSLTTLTGITAGTLRVGEVDGVTTAQSILVTGPYGRGNVALDLESLGAITERGSGTLTTPLLTGTARGAVTLDGDNDVRVIGEFTVAVFGMTLADAGAPRLTVDGPLTAQTVTLTAPVIDIPAAGAIYANTSVTLTSTDGNITEDGTGSIATTLLTGSASGSATLDGDNTIANLGPFTTATGFTMNAGGTKLTVVGAVDGGTDVTLIDTAALAIDAPLSATGSVDLTAAGISQTAAGVITAGTLTGDTGPRAADFGTAANLVTNLGSFTADGGFTLNNATPTLTVTGDTTGGEAFVTLINTGGLAIDAPINPTAVVTLVADGIVQSAAGVITAGTLAGSAGAGSADLGTALNHVANLGAFTAATGFSLNDNAAPLTVIGAVNGGTSVTLANTVALAIDAPVSAAGTLELTAAGISQGTAGVITAGKLEGTSEADGANLGTADNHVARLGPFVAGGGFGLFDEHTLAVVGNVTAGTEVLITVGGAGHNLDIEQGVTVKSSAAGSVALTANAGELTNGGTVRGGGLAELTAGTDITQSGLVTAAVVTETARGNFTQTDTGTTAATAGDASLTATTGTLTQNGTVTSAADAILTATAGTLDQNGSVTAAGSATLLAATDLSQTGKVEATAGSATLIATGGTLVQSGSIGAGQSVTLSSASDMTVTGPVNAAAGNANFTAGGNYTQSSVVGAGVDVSITAQGSLTENGIVTAGNDASLTAVLGTLAQNGTVGAGGNAFLAATNGTLDQTGHVTAGNTATLAAGIDLSQTGTVNAITDTLFAAGNLTQAGSVNASGNATLTAANGTLDQTGSVTAGGNADLTATNGVLDQGGDVTANGAVDLTAGTDLSQTGIVHAFGGDADLTAGHDLTQSNIVTASADVMLTASSGNLSQTGSVTAGTSAIIQALVGNLTEGGIVTAPNIQVSAPDGTVDFSGSFAGVVPDPTLNPNLKLQKGSFPTDTSIGAWISASTIAVAPSAVVTGAGGGRSQLVISLTSPNGSVSFGNFNNQQTDLYLDLGTGFASGQIEVEALQVEYTPPGTARTINLLGTVNGQSASTAATASFIQPLTKANYQVNGCAIESTSCIRIATIVLPTINPLKDLEVETPLQADDILVILPDVGERDY